MTIIPKIRILPQILYAMLSFLFCKMSLWIFSFDGTHLATFLGDYLRRVMLLSKWGGENYTGIAGIWPRPCNLLVLNQSLGCEPWTVTGAVYCLAVSPTHLCLKPSPSPEIQASHLLTSGVGQMDFYLVECSRDPKLKMYNAFSSPERRRIRNNS